MSRYDVAIVGLGPTGATLANLCGLHGLRTVVHERSSAVFSQPRACHLDAEVARVFQQCGFEHELRELLTVSAGMEYVDCAGHPLRCDGEDLLLVLRVGPLREPFDPPCCVGLPQAFLRHTMIVRRLPLGR